jgi:hypothetical protein
VIPGMILKHRKHLITQFLIEPWCLEIVGVEEHVSASVGCVSIVKGPMSMDDVSPRDCIPSLLRVLCCHIPCAVSTAKPALAWERCRGDALMDLATVDKLLTTT